MKLLPFFILLLLPFPLDGQYPIIHSDFDIFFLDIGYFHLDLKLAVSLADVDAGRPITRYDKFLALVSRPTHRPHVAVEHVVYSTQRFPFTSAMILFLHCAGLIFLAGWPAFHQARPGALMTVVPKASSFHYSIRFPHQNREPHSTAPFGAPKAIDLSDRTHRDGPPSWRSGC